MGWSSEGPRKNNLTLSEETIHLIMSTGIDLNQNKTPKLKYIPSNSPRKLYCMPNNYCETLVIGSLIPYYK